MVKKSAVLAEAKRLWDLGFAIHWLRPKSKVPYGGWSKNSVGAPRDSWEVLVKKYVDGNNVGVRLGTPSKIGKRYLTVVDIDIKSDNPVHAAEANASVKQFLGDIEFPCVTSGRGNGSMHLYAFTPEPVKAKQIAKSKEKAKVFMPSANKANQPPSKHERETLTAEEIKSGIRIRACWEISLLGEGQQVVLPPSIHPDSGKRYEWAAPFTSITAIPTLPQFSVAPQASPNDAALTATGGVASDPGATSAPGLTGFQVEPVDLGWIDISPEVRAAIVDGVGVTDRSGYLLRASSALISAGLTQNEVLSVLTDPKTFLGATAYDGNHANTKSRKRAAMWVYKYTVAKVARERSGEGVFTKADTLAPPKKLSQKEIEATAEELAELHDWTQDIDRTEKGRTRITLKNLDLILTNAVEGKIFIEDHFASRIEYGCDTPWGGKAGEHINDIDMVKVKRWLADTEFQIEPPTNAIFEATNLLANRYRVHPVRDWLEKLEWDGTPRVNTWLRDYCLGFGEEPYLSEVSRKFIQAMVTRIFWPGCQWDYMLVLEGVQGQKKSTLPRTLASDKWFMDHLPDLRDKDSILNLQGKWLIEIPELDKIKNSDFNLVKPYISRRVDTVRPHYGRLKNDVPRQSVFIGTVNEGQYFKDPTGNRRYWPVKVGRCDVDGLLKVREQLFAEAMVIYREGKEILMLSPKAEAQARDAQEHRLVDDDTSEMRNSLLQFMDSENSRQFDFSRFQVRELMTGVNAPWSTWANARGNIFNVAAHVLSSVGFKKGKSGSVRYWYHSKNR